MKKRLMIWITTALYFSALFSTPVLANVASQISAAENELGLDNSAKTAIERVSILEVQLGISDANGTLVERLARIENKLGIVSDGNAEDITESVSTSEFEPLIAPSDEYV